MCLICLRCCVARCSPGKPLADAGGSASANPSLSQIDKPADPVNHHCESLQHPARLYSSGGGRFDVLTRMCFSPSRASDRPMRWRRCAHRAARPHSLAQAMPRICGRDLQWGQITASFQQGGSAAPHHTMTTAVQQQPCCRTARQQLLSTRGQQQPTAGGAEPVCLWKPARPCRWQQLAAAGRLRAARSAGCCCCKGR